jgi:WhiB family redox-sensing transcriptional regulator
MDDWLKQAACRGMDLRVFFPAGGESIKEAKQVCRRCSVRDECLMFALSLPEVEDQVGVYGGVSATGRRRLRRAITARNRA